MFTNSISVELTDGGGGGGGGGPKSYEGEKAWSSINHSMFADIYAMPKVD